MTYSIRQAPLSTAPMLRERWAAAAWSCSTRQKLAPRNPGAAICGPELRCVGMLAHGRAETRPCRFSAADLLRFRPALHQLLIGDRLALRLLVVELRRRAVLLAEPLGGILLLVEARAAAAVDIGLL